MPNICAVTTFGDKVARARTKAKLTQEQLAERVGVSRSWVGQVETNRQRSARPATLRRLSEELGLDYRELLALTNQLGEIDQPESASGGSDMAALIAAQTAVLSEIRDELRLGRLVSERSARVLAELLGANADSLDRADTPDASDARAPLGTPGR